METLPAGMFVVRVARRQPVCDEARVPWRGQTFVEGRAAARWTNVGRSSDNPDRSGL